MHKNARFSIETKSALLRSFHGFHCSDAMMPKLFRYFCDDFHIDFLRYYQRSKKERVHVDTWYKRILDYTLEVPATSLNRILWWIKDSDIEVCLTATSFNCSFVFTKSCWRGNTLYYRRCNIMKVPGRIRAALPICTSKSPSGLWINPPFVFLTISPCFSTLGSYSRTCRLEMSVVM